MEQEGVAEEAQNDLGCYYQSYYKTGYYNLCVGSACYYDSRCNSGCCSYYGGYCQYSSWCDNDINLAWLWWTLASICIILCVVSMILGAKRRRR